MKRLSFAIKQIKQILNPTDIKIVYEALVESLISCSIIGWGGVSYLLMVWNYFWIKLIKKILLLFMVTLIEIL